MVHEGHVSAVVDVAFAPTGKEFAAASTDKTVRIWDAVNGGDPLLVLKAHTGEVNSAMFSTDGTKVVSASDDKTVRIWAAKNGTCEKVLEGHR